VISVTANVAPRAMSEMVSAALAGDGAAAQRLDTRLSGLHRELFVEANPIPVKWALAQMGLIASGIRLRSRHYRRSIRRACGRLRVLRARCPEAAHRGSSSQANEVHE